MLHAKQKAAGIVSHWGFMTAICQKSLADAPWTHDRTRKLPGVQPLDPKNWLIVDDAYSAQLKERATILAENRENVLLIQPDASDAVAELYEFVLADLSTREGFEVDDTSCVRADGHTVALDPNRPFETLNQLVVEDFCILQKRGSEHVLTAALLCFPASWMLAQKFGAPLSRIHAPVPEYDAGIEKRVQRLFDAVQVGRPLWRANSLRYHDPKLYQPRTESERRSKSDNRPYVRSERQCIVRLPKTDAVVFSIQTRQVHYDDLTADQRQGLVVHPVDHEDFGHE